MKLLKCIAEIYFNQQCTLRTLIPKYAKMKIPNSHRQQNLVRKIFKQSVKDGINFFLY